MILLVAVLMLLCSLVPAALFFRNLRLYQPPPAAVGTHPSISVLIPARDEAHGIAAAIQAALASTGCNFEIVVMDDSSTDGTDTIVRSLAALDPRVRLEHAPPLPAGWNGKQHACWALAHAARFPILCFVDADVRLGPECIARMAHLLETGDNGLVTGFPRQLTGTFLEWMLLPLIHFVLLGFLPLSRMRRGTDPALAAGCGQFIMARADRYFACGGHSGIRLTMHDGLLLPRLFRAAGFRTDLADLTSLATCRMYTSATQVWSGLAKNATEGIASPGRIVPISLILLIGQVLPFAFSSWVVIAIAYVGFVWHFGFIFGPTRPKLAALVFGTICMTLFADWAVRFAAARRFRQDWRSALLHPFGILLLLAVQWYALVRKLAGGKVSWKERAYTGD